jgi:TolB protein
VNLTNSPDDDQQPVWSPDGTLLAWRKNWDIWIMNANGTNPRQLTSGITAQRPAWSPDGKWICFDGFTSSGHEDVFIIAADGSGSPINLTNNPAADLGASWSADSHEIAFETNRHSVISGGHTITENWELYKVDISTTLQTRLTNNSTDQDMAAAWSPDGSRIAFISDRDAPQYDFNVYVMNPDGSDQRRVVTLNAGRPLAWSPDGKRLALQVGGSESAEIYVVDVDAGTITRLTDNTQEDTWPIWRPDTWQ